MAKPNWTRNLDQLLHLKGMELHDKMTRTSAVTTAWGVFWVENLIARDLMQNFFDANRGNLSEVKVEVLAGEKGSDVTISAPSAYNLQRLFYLGSEKREHDVGEYGEGFKAAAVNLLRDWGVELIAVSGNLCVHLHLSEDVVEDTQLHPIVYEFYQLPVTHDGTLLLLPDCSEPLANALQNGLTHFQTQAARRYCDSGDSYRDLGEYQRAIVDYHKAIELDPYYSLAYYNRGLCYQEQLQYQLAIEDSYNGIEDYDKTFEYFDLATLDSKAIEDFDKAIELDPYYSLAYYNRGLCYQEQLQYQRAIEDWDKVIELDPNDPYYAYQAYYNRGICYRLMGQDQRAIEDWDKVIGLDPNCPEAYDDRGRSYQDLGQYQLAIEDFDKAIELRPTSRRYLFRGHYYRRLGQHQRAIEGYDKAIELDPSMAAAYYNRGHSYHDLGQYQRAIEDYDKAIERWHPPGFGVYNSRGLSYRELGQHQRAIEDFDKAIERWYPTAGLYPTYGAGPYNNRGLSYHDLGQYQRAIEDFDKAIELDPDYAETRTHRERALRALDESAKPEARTWLVEMCARFPVAELETLIKLTLVKKMADILKNAG